MNIRGAAAALCGNIAGTGRVLAPGPGHSRHDRSLSVLFSPDAPEGFAVASFAGDDWRACRDHVRACLRLPSWEPAARSGTRPTHSVNPSNDLADRRARALTIWNRRKPITDTIAERYLREARGYRGAIPATLAYLPPRGDGQHPAMIAAFGYATEPEPGVLLVADDCVGAIHITLLRPDGNGKAGTERDKIMIGAVKGSPICIAPANDLLGLVITEGIEDALSVFAATGLGAWAAGSASFMPSLADALPNYIDAVSVMAHADPAGQRGANDLARGLRERGLDTKIITMAGAVPR